MEFSFSYKGSSSVASMTDRTEMSFAPDVNREPTFFSGELRKKIEFREAISALHDVVVSDLRFKPKDKTAYKEWAAQQEALWMAEHMGSYNADAASKRMDALRSELTELREKKSKIMQPFF